ncbi:MAG: ABC transporter substrate-binding protein [[Clostridium] aminophilum]|uniref:ABC transporter substrate-binding protein n=1 Tax=[Clostridium] aminophilum TaxID=1526 RepID=UPI0026EE02DE|nr:ABC transporter substrate-binding protein [[Clostridium] aminophilum]MDD6196269.1 ABC transporter substrate-binding protein [[Clostridium] aminophilum]
MKRRNLTAALVMGTMAAGILAGCGGAQKTSGTGASSAAAETAASSGAETDGGTTQDAAGKKEFKVGIVQFMDHPSLNQIEENLEKELDKIAQEKGVTFNYKDYTHNGQGDATILNQIGSQLIADEVDVIVPIATPAAQVMQSAAEDSATPIVFSAVSDPVGAKLVADMKKPGANITGTSDALNTNAIMDLILALNPDARKIGLLYSKSEDSSAQPIADAKKYLEGKGISCVEKTGTTSDEVSAAVDALIAEGVDAVFTPTDNTVQSAELGFYEKLAEAKIPHYAGADSFALNGAFCGYGVDYANLGVATADMVAEILVDGRKPAETAVQTFDNGIATVNTDTAAAIGIDLAQVRTAFTPFCTQIAEIKTQKEFKN